MEHMHADAVMEMDADFSHDPEDVPRLIQGLESGADFVIGSRYVLGGAIPNEWSYIRKLNSKCRNIFARYVAGMSNIKDCTAGFRAIRLSLLQKVDLSNLRVTGYAFQIALLNKAILLKAKIIEVPVIFIDRKRGETKLGLSDILEFMKNAWWTPRFITYKPPGTVQTTPTSSLSSPKNSGAAIPNITDGFSGDAPDRGALISGVPTPIWGDGSEAEPRHEAQRLPTVKGRE